MIPKINCFPCLNTSPKKILHQGCAPLKSLYFLFERAVTKMYHIIFSWGDRQVSHQNSSLIPYQFENTLSDPSTVTVGNNLLQIKTPTVNARAKAAIMEFAKKMSESIQSYINQHKINKIELCIVSEAGDSKKNTSFTLISEDGREISSIDSRQMDKLAEQYLTWFDERCQSYGSFNLSTTAFFHQIEPPEEILVKQIKHRYSVSQGEIKQRTSHSKLSIEKKHLENYKKHI